MKSQGIFGLGNPLLDIQATVKPEILEEFSLKPNDAILAELRHMEIFTRLENTPGVEYVAGGATQNSLRVAKWALVVKLGRADIPCTFMGAVGSDDRGRKMLAACQGSGKIHCMYQVNTEGTGTCAICITQFGRARSLVANVGAAAKFDFRVFEASLPDLIKSHGIFYNEGYFICSSADSVRHMAKAAHAAGKTYATNISAPFIAQVPAFREVLMDCMPFTGLLFGNDAEALALGYALGWEGELVEICKKLATYQHADGVHRVVVITRGGDSTLVSNARGEVVEVPIIPVSELVDTNGAGDAYVGGFLAGLACGKDVLECCRLGAEAASMIIQRSGCSLPDYNE